MTHDTTPAERKVALLTVKMAPCVTRGPWAFVYGSSYALMTLLWALKYKSHPSVSTLLSWWDSVSPGRSDTVITAYQGTWPLTCRAETTATKEVRTFTSQLIMCNYSFILFMTWHLPLSLQTSSWNWTVMNEREQKTFNDIFRLRKCYRALSCRKLPLSSLWIGRENRVNQKINCHLCNALILMKYVSKQWENYNSLQNCNTLKHPAFENWTDITCPN